MNLQVIASRLVVAARDGRGLIFQANGDRTILTDRSQFLIAPLWTVVGALHQAAAPMPVADLCVWSKGGSAWLGNGPDLWPTIERALKRAWIGGTEDPHEAAWHTDRIPAFVWSERRVLRVNPALLEGIERGDALFLGPDGRVDETPELVGEGVLWARDGGVVYGLLPMMGEPDDFTKLRDEAETLAAVLRAYPAGPPRQPTAEASTAAESEVAAGVGE